MLLKSDQLVEVAEGALKLICLEKVLVPRIPSDIEGVQIAQNALDGLGKENEIAHLILFLLDLLFLLFCLLLLLIVLVYQSILN